MIVAFLIWLELVMLFTLLAGGVVWVADRIRARRNG